MITEVNLFSIFPHRRDWRDLEAGFCTLSPHQILSLHAEISLYLLTHLLLSTSAQLALYELDINQNAGKGIFVTYHQVTIVEHCLSPWLWSKCWQDTGYATTHSWAEYNGTIDKEKWPQGLISFTFCQRSDFYNKKILKLVGLFVDFRFSTQGFQLIYSFYIKPNKAFRNFKAVLPSNSHNRLIVFEDLECIYSLMPMMMTTPTSCTVNIILADRLLGFARKEPSIVPGTEKCLTSSSGALPAL